MAFIANPVKRLTHSLFARLLLIFVLASIAYGFAARHAYFLFQDFDYLRRTAGAHVVLHSEYVLKDLGTPPDIRRAQEISAELPIDIRMTGPGLDWSSVDDFYDLEAIPFRPLSWLDIAEIDESGSDAWVAKLENVEIARYKEHTLVRITDNGYQIIFASPRISELPDPDYSTWIVGFIGALILLLCYLAVRWLIQPITWMQEGAARIGRGELDYRIPTPRHDELGQLSHDINAMAEDVEGMLDAKQQLLLAISHELRSPVTRAKVASEFISDENTRQGILEDLDEMERLISDLLESEALNTRHAILHREPVHLGDLVTAVVATDFTNRKDHISVEVEPQLPEIQLDARRIRLLIRNLIDNALRYNPTDEKPVEVSVGRQGENLIIGVCDHGPGIPDEHLDYVTEPFYRADPARSRSTGGIGLGLYLCRRVVEVHGGQLTLHSGSGFGTRVTATLPAVE